jgi:phosphatidylinositol glycan class C protein
MLKISVYNSGWDFTRSTLICLLGGFIVSPILKTLTESISTDTVYAMVTLMILLHVIFFDYGIESAIVSPPISLNAALFGAVCLASRLSTISAFTLLIFAADIFVLVSLIRLQLEKKVSREIRTCISAAVIVISITSVWTRTTIVRVSYLMLLLLMNVVFPFCFFKLQNMKE